MKIRKAHLQRLEARGTLGPGGADAVWTGLSELLAEEPAFRAQHLLYYAGALLMLLPLTLFVSAGFLAVGDAGVAVLAALVGAATWVAAARLLSAGRRIAAGAFAVVSLATVPLAAWALLRLAGVDLSVGDEGYRDFHTRISATWLLLEAITLAASVVWLWRFRLPFLVMPVAIVLWYVGMDAAARFTDAGLPEVARGWSLGYGLALLAGAWLVDRRTRHTLWDHTFWLWLAGTTSFWCALSAGDGDEWAKLGYAAVNAAMLALSVVVGRRVLAVFGGLGLAGWLGHLSLKVFGDVAAFPLVTLVLGAAVVGLGLKWPAIEARFARRRAG
ncbi:MAG: DUF2157 domain-containing protein [Burkholderiales bacterium]|jgi:hypothetical protein